MFFRNGEKEGAIAIRIFIPIIVLSVGLVGYICYMSFFAGQVEEVANKETLKTVVREPVEDIKEEVDETVKEKVSGNLYENDEIHISTYENNSNKHHVVDPDGKKEVKETEPIVIKKQQLKEKSEDEAFVAKEGFSGSGENTFTKPSMSVELKEGSLEQAIYEADYVFVGYVETQLKTTYEEGLIIETDDGEQQNSTPMTNLKIQVMDSMKGSLGANEVVYIKKYGGLNQDGKSQLILKGDSLPKEGLYYVFIATSLGENHLYIEGVWSNKEIPLKSKNALKESTVYQKYEAAIKSLELSKKK